MVWLIAKGGRMHAERRQAYDREMHAAAEHYSGNNLDKAFYHLERAHILGQSFAFAHTNTHWWMLKVGWKRRDPTEIRGQVGRIIGALIFSRIGCRWGIPVVRTFILLGPCPYRKSFRPC
jgi:hypothetical protein